MVKNMMVDKVKLQATQQLAMLLLCVVFYLAQVLSGNHALGLSNWFIGDGITLYKIVHVRSLDYHWWPIGRAQGIYFIHVYPYMILGGLGFIIVNIFLVSILFRRFGVTIVLLFPFYLISLVLPSKDLVMLALILFWSYCLINALWVRAITLVLIMYYFRDGDMFISLACTLAIILWWLGISWRLLGFLGVVTGSFLFVFGKSILGGIPIYSAYVGAHSSISWVGAYTFPYYLVRLVGNASNLALRTVFVDVSGGLSLSAILTYISGVSMLTAFCLAFFSFIRNDFRKRTSFASLLLIIALATLSINPLVQPRYLMPYTVAFFVLVRGHYTSQERWAALGASLMLSVLGMLTYPLLPVPMPPIPIIVNFALF